MFKIGDIVAFKTHPFFSEHTDIVLAGDPLQQSPLMIVTEEKNAVPGSDKDNKKKPDPIINYRCYWYSAASRGFEFAWFSAAQLKLIESIPADFDSIPAIGSNVIFRTANLEIQKKKGSMQYGMGMAAEDHFGVKSLMSFVSPILLVTAHLDDGRKTTKKQPDAPPSFPFLKVKWFCKFR